MYIEEFLRSKAEDFTKKFKKENITVEVFAERKKEFYVMQVPGCDELYTNSKKFKNWKDNFEKECLDYISQAFVLVTDVYLLDKSFRRIY